MPTLLDAAARHSRLWICILGLLADVAYAGNYLLPAQVLDSGKADIYLSVSHVSDSANIAAISGPWALSGSESSDLVDLYLRVRLGVGHGWQLGFAVEDAPHYMARNDGVLQFPEASPVFEFHNSSHSQEGRQNPTVSAGYLVIDDAETPFALTGELQASPAVPGHPTRYLGALTAAWETSPGTMRPYLSLFQRNVRAPDSADAVGVSAGVYWQLTRDSSLAPYASHVKYRTTSSEPGQSQDALGLTLLQRIGPRFYFEPSLSVYRNSAVDAKPSNLHRDSSRGRAVTLALYHAF